MEIKKDNELKNLMFKCSELGCSYMAGLSFNKANVVWFKCQGKCKEKKDVNSILEANCVDMLDNRLD